jgi:hypothetical protein
MIMNFISKKFMECGGCEPPLPRSNTPIGRAIMSRAGNVLSRKKLLNIGLKKLNKRLGYY